ncbi:phosphopantetheine-binding protein [Nonomuraea sp. 10N515B]|uniref:phosphopantetheine-binding protein n=1 Tax=Nonomuraea sp. 10N515B TaxID=3457422 RepID=UPI003FCEADFC
MSHADVIKQFVLTQFLSDVSADELPDDYDFIANGVIDSLGILKLIAWLEETFQVVLDYSELDPSHFRTVESIDAFVTAARGQGALS